MSANSIDFMDNFKKNFLNYDLSTNSQNKYDGSNNSVFDDCLLGESDAVPKTIGAEEHPLWSDFWGGFVDAFDGKSKDGAIGDTSQGATGDCWLLSGVNALSYTEEGRKVIENTLDYKDGYTVVHTMAGDYVVTDNEVKRTKGSKQYSDGDDDMIILELAIEKVIDDYIFGNISLEDDAPEGLKALLENKGDDGMSQSTIPGYSSTTGGCTHQLMYLLTGKKGSYISDKADMSSALEQFEQNEGKDYALGASTGDANIETKDVNGNKITIVHNHAYAVKKVDGDNVTVINPWDSGEEIVLKKDTFLNVFKSVQVCDMSSSNPKQEFVDQKAYYNSEGKLAKTIKYVEDEELTRYKKFSYDYNNELEKTVSGYEYDSGFFGKKVYDEEGRLTTGQIGNRNTDMLLRYKTDKDGNKYDFKFGGIDNDDTLRYTFVNMNDEIGNRIYSNYQIMLRKNLTAQNVFSLAKNLDDTQFEKAVEYLNEHKNATYEEVLENI